MDASIVRFNSMADVHTFASLQIWTLVMKVLLVQSRFLHTIYSTWSHTFSYSPNTALCSLQSFEENPLCYGAKFHHTARGRGCIRHTS